MGDKEGPSSSRSSGECSGRMMMMLMMLMRLRLVRNKEMIACARPPVRPSHRSPPCRQRDPSWLQFHHASCASMSAWSRSIYVPCMTRALIWALKTTL